MATTVRHIYRGSSGDTEDLVVTIRTLDGTTLSAQAVAFSFNNGASWLTAAWQGSAGTTRKAKVTLTTGGNMPAAGRYPDILAKVGTVAFRVGAAWVH